MLPADTKLSSKGLFERLTGHIEVLRDSFRRLSKAATLYDLGVHFGTILRGIIDGAVIDVALWPATAKGWELIVDGGSGLRGKLPSEPEAAMTSACEVMTTPDSIIIVQRLVDKSFLGLIVRSSHRDPGFSDLDVVILRLFIQLFDTAHQDLLFRRNERELIFTLKHRILQLNSLVDTGIEIASLHQDAMPHHLALLRAASLTNASRGVVRVTRGEKLQEEHLFPEGAELPPSADKGHIISAEFTFASDTYSFKLYNKESRSGVIPFESTDQLLLDALSRQVQASLENRELHLKALENERTERDMKVAAAIQKKIIPASLPPIKAYDLAARNIPSKSVGGDYYDCIPLPDGRYALVVADVSGKGVPAALLVSSMHAYLWAYLELAGSLPELMVKLNKAIYNSSTEDKFATAFIAILSPLTGEIEYSSAGHNPGYILKNDRTVQEINMGGFPLGAFDLPLKYKSEKFTLAPGERFLLYTDGVTEADNGKEEFYEHTNPLPDFLKAHAELSVEAFVDELLASIKRFTGSAPQNDDITALYLRRQA